MSLWEEGREQFVRDLRGQRTDEGTIHNFLRDKATSEDVERSCRALQADSDRKYGQIEIAGKAIPKKWIQRIMDNIDKFTAIGDFAMKGAPETVGLAWFAIKQVLNVVQNNYKLYDFFGQSITSITEMLVLIRVYDKLYDERSKSSWQASDIVGELFSQIRNVYAAILDFSFSVKKHIKGGKLAKVGHAIKDMFGADLAEFEGKMGKIQELKAKILEASQGAFQEKTFEKLDGVTSTLTNVTGTLSFLSQAVQSSLQGVQEMKQLLEEGFKFSKFKSIYDIALQDFERNKKALDPLPDTRTIFETYLKQRRENTCTWIQELDQYQIWRKSQMSSILVIKGRPGSGKSVLLASIIERLQLELKEDSEYSVQYLFCETNRAGGDSSQSLARIENTLIYQLYELSTYSERDSLLLQTCNDGFKNPKRKIAQSGLTASVKDAGLTARAKKEDTNFELDEAFETLTQALHKKVFLIVDGVDCVPDYDQGKFVSDLQALVAREMPCVHVLLSCQSTGDIYKQLSSAFSQEISVDANNRADIDRLVFRELSLIPGLSQPEIDEASKTVCKKTGSNFKYVVQVALPFLRQPFQRPLSNHLKELPDSMNGTYEQHLYQLSPNYLSLLQIALAWTLLAKREVSVQEIMDAYTGTYRAEVLVDDRKGYVNTDGYKLYTKQIRDAAGPFLDIVDKGTTHVLRLEDANAIGEFCFKSASEKNREEVLSNEVCARCKTELDSSQVLSLSQKSGHLAIAITCLRHLNSPLFQQRYLSIGSALPEIATESHDQPPEEVPDDKSSDSDNADTLGLDRDQAGDHPEEDPHYVVQSTEETDSDDSQDSEDRHDVVGWAEQQTADQEEEEIDLEDIASTEKEKLRYEINYWFFHIQEAERLSTLEERQNSAEWKELLAELDRFVVKTPEVFEAWKRTHFFSSGRTWKPIHVAAYYGVKCLIEHLLSLSQGAEIKSMSEQGLTPLHLAAESPYPLDILKLLLASGAEPNFEAEGSSVPAFHYWIVCGANFECVQELLRHGASCSLIDQHGLNIMHYFAWLGFDPKVLELLLENKENPDNHGRLDVEGNGGDQPLHRLMARTDIPLELLKAFVEHGADVNKENNRSQQPLLEAASYGETDAIEMIIDKVIDIDDPNDWGRTALHAAAWEGHTDTVKLLLKHKAKPNITDYHDRTPLFFACLCSTARLASSEATAQVLLDQLLLDSYRIEEINMLTKRRRTPLREAAAHGFTKIVRTILDMIDVKDTSIIDTQDLMKGRNALHCASLHGHVDIVQMLLRYGADATLRDTTGRTALDLCHQQWARMASSQHEATLSALIDVDPTTGGQNKDLLATAAMNGSIIILEKLLDAKADLNEPDQYGWTPLLLAKQFQRAQAVEFLSRRVAQIGLKPTKWNYTSKVDSIDVSENGCRITYPQEPRLCIMADHPAPPGLQRYYYEIDIFESPNARGRDPKPNPILAIGFCTSSAHSLTFPGWPERMAPNTLSWAYHGDDGGFFSSIKSRPIGFSKPFGPGDTVGCGVDYEDARIFFTCNGERIDDLFFDNVRGRLFPVLGFKDQLIIEANFGNDLKKKPFKWSEEADLIKMKV